jgi:hypothetical protein
MLICGASLLMLGRPAVAQEVDRRQGFWWGLGVTYGWVHVSCDICQGNRNAAPSIGIRAGGAINRKFALGGEVNGWTRSEEEVDEYLASFSAIALWYPTGGAFYLKGGLGYVMYRIDDNEDNVLTSSGFGPQVGLGYEIGVTRRISIQPYLNAIVTIPTANLYFNGDTQADGVSLSLFQVGLGLTWH